MALSIVVLAAGQGKRMRSRLPKVLQPLAGRPMLAHVLDLARSLNPADIHVVYGHGGDAVRSAFTDADLSWALQAEQLGTGHAVAQAMPNIADADRVLVLCGDVPLTRKETIERLLDDGRDTSLAVLTVTMADPTGYGRIVRNDEGHVARIVEQKDASASERTIDEINTGIVVAEARALRRWLGQLKNDNTQSEYYLTDIVALAATEGVPVVAVRLEDADEAMGVNDKTQLALSERKLQRSRADEIMRQGATVADPARIDIRGVLTVGSDVYIDINAVFIGAVSLSDGCRIGPNCVIRDSELGPGTEVHANSVIEEATIAANCSVGPFARVRPGTELAADVKIGNFVETKKASIATGSKVNHLSYIGDSTIGTNVNVGAGTITCNYDGANKHRTTIGDDVFVGSGVNLVAPITLGDGSTIGAGSTLNKDAPPGELTVARVRQTSIAGWRRPRKKRE